MKIGSTLRGLCTPAYIYLVISVVAIIAIMFQNTGNTNKFCVGAYECNVDNTAIMFLGQGIYVLFWTFILNSICKAGYKEVSWLLVLLPFLLFFVLIGLLMVVKTTEPYSINF